MERAGDEDGGDTDDISYQGLIKDIMMA